MTRRPNVLLISVVSLQYGFYSDKLGFLDIFRQKLRLITKYTVLFGFLIKKHSTLKYSYLSRKR